jgi:hypothetical protein
MFARCAAERNPPSAAIAALMRRFSTADGVQAIRG